MQSLSQNPATPSYILSAISAFYLKVKFKVKQADVYFKRYRVSLSRLQVFDKQFKAITNENLSFDSVILKIDISKNNLGKIIDYTPGYKDHLGEPKNGQSIKGVNINSLMPG